MFPGHSQVSPQALWQLFIEIISKHVSWRSPYNNFTGGETEAHVIATVNPRTSSHRLFFFQCFSFVGNTSIPSCDCWGILHAPPLLSQFSSSYTYSVLCPGTNQGPQIMVTESEALLITAFKADADLFSSAGVFFSSVVFAALFAVYIALHWSSSCLFFVAYGHWGYSLSFTSVSRLITLIFF